MRLQRYFGGFVVALLVIVSISYFVGRKSVEAPSTIVTDDKATLINNGGSTSTQSLPLKGVATFKSLHAENKDLVCEITSIDNSRGAFSGKLYLTDQNLRGDFAVQQGGRLFSAGMFIITDMLYFWTDTAQERISFRIKTDAAVINNPGPNFNIGLNETVSYDCLVATNSSELFVLPADLAFPEITE